jgi:hypothetical protein
MSKPIPARSMTPRGFTIYDEFTDTSGSKVRVQESSIATDPRCWIFTDAASSMAATYVPHLNVEQAQRVRDALTAFIEEQQETLQAEGLAAADLPG